MYIKTKINTTWTAGTLLLVVLLPGGAPSLAGAPASPDDIAGAVTIDAGQVIAQVQQRPDTVLIDARVGVDRADGYIEGSVHLVDTRTDCESLAGLIGSLTTPAIFYCNGVGCDRSGRAVRIALACGYREVYWFRGGIEEWRAREFPLIRDVPE